MFACRQAASFAFMFGAVVFQVRAADLLPPPWRGESGSTFARWSFAGPEQIGDADVAVNSHGTPTLAVTVNPLGSGWWDQLPGLGMQTGYWDIGGAGGQMAITIPEQEAANGHREIVIQVTCFSDISQPPGVQVAGGTVTEQATAVVEQVVTGGAWVLERFTVTLGSAPAYDQILLVADPDWGTIIDDVVIDTRSFVIPVTGAAPSQDRDGDGDVDAVDLSHFEACAAGPALPWPAGSPECVCFDADGDLDVDQEDFGVFQRCYSGEGITADVDCASS